MGERESSRVNCFAVAVTFKPVGSNQASATGTYPNVFCCPLLVQVSGAQFSWLERVLVTQGVAHKSCDYFWQEIGIG
jgi:hypothetical protein